MKAIDYKVELFDIVHDLSLINNEIIFAKSEDKTKVQIKRRDVAQSIAYILEAPVSYFNFDSDDVSFYSYNEFYQYFRVFNNPELKFDTNKIYISENNSKVDYILSDKESLDSKGFFNNIKFGDTDIKINLSASDLDELVKMSNLIKAKKAKLTVTGDSISIRLFNNMHENSFEKIFKVERVSDFKDDVSFIIFADMFNKIPQKKNYVIELKRQGIIKLQLVDENINLSVYSSQVKN